MKKIILISLFSIAVNYLTAQEVAEYFTANLDAYTGIWEYADDTCTFRIYLKKGKSYYHYGPLSHEKVYGGHYIARNGIVITDLKEAVKQAIEEPQIGMTLSASNFEYEENLVNPNVLRFVFGDDLKDKMGGGLLTLISGNPMQLRWQILKESERVYYWEVGVDPEPVIHEGWTVPEDVILTKISDVVQ